MDKLLRELTLEEKMNLIRGGIEDPVTFQGQAGYIPGVRRLGIPSLRLADGPPGVLTRHPSQAEPATMAVAATFSRKDAEENGVVIGREARALGIDVTLQPFINIDRDITFWRGYNTFGEDPFLTGQMGAAEIRGVQSQDVMAQAKHYIAYDSASDNIFVDPQTLHEVYLAPFAEAVKANVSSIMCSYNRVNGTYSCGNRDTLETILKGELGFKGFVTSDWGAVHSVTFINCGLDMEMPGTFSLDSPFSPLMHTFFETTPRQNSAPKEFDETELAELATEAVSGGIPEEPPILPSDISSFLHVTDRRNMRDALRDGSVTEATITQAAGRVLYEMDQFGYLDGKSKHHITPQSIEANARIIEKTAEDSAVLLRNEGHALPLNPADLQSLVLIGPGAGQVDAIGSFGERSGGLTGRQVGPLEALKKNTADMQGVRITYAVDDDMTGNPIPGELLSHDGQSGLERSGADSAQIDPQIDFTVSNGKALPANGAYTWKGTLSVPDAGEYWIYLQVLGARGILNIDGKTIGHTGAVAGEVHGDVQQAAQDNVFPTTDGLDNVRRAVQLGAGQHPISLAISGDTSNIPEQVRLSWVTPGQRQASHAAAIAAAGSAKTAVIFLWTRGTPSFSLPGEQNKLVDEISAVNPNTIVVLNVSQPVDMPWISKVKAILQMWWPGDEGGWATANILLGRANPSGRLPFTWARSLEDYPATDPAYPERSARGVAGKTTFSEGVNIGYRWFDKQNIRPLFPFGYGLSYTTFRYSDLRVSHSADDGLDVSVRIQNTGNLRGDEVPQVYLDAPESRPEGVQFAVRTLAAFDRITLDPGKTQDVTLHVAARCLEYWSTAENRWIRAEARLVRVGGSSRDLKLSEQTR